MQNPISKILGKSSNGVSGPKSATLATGKVTACPGLMPWHSTMFSKVREDSREVEECNGVGSSQTGQSWVYEVKKI